MHSHLHTKDNINCSEIMNMLDECHAQGFLHKAFAGCNEIKREVNRCLGAERYRRAQNNRDKARENRKRIEEVWKKDDEL